MSGDPPAIAIRKQARRRFAAQVAVRCEAWASREPVALTARDISVSGMFIQTDAAPPLGSLIDIQLRPLGGGPPRVIAAEVIRIVVPESDELLLGMEVEFLTIADEDRVVLEQLAALERSAPPATPAASALGGSGASAGGDARQQAEQKRIAATLRARLALLEKADPHDKLDLSRDADIKAIRSAFRQLSKRFHPDRYSRYDQQIQGLAQEIYLQLSEAELTLREEKSSRSARADDKPPVAPAPEPPARTVLGDEQQPKVRQREVNALRRRMLRSSLERRQVQQSPLSASKTASALTTKSEQVEAAKGITALREGRYRDARNVFAALVKQQPKNAEYRASLSIAQGYLARTDGLVEEAQQHFEAAYDADPSCIELIEQLRRQEEQKKSKGRGMLSRLIKRK